MYQYKAIIDRVIDGDTVVMTVDLGFYTYMKLHLRLYGIDTPERGEAGWSEATQFVKDFFTHNPIVVVNIYGQDKYGRWLAEIVDSLGGTLNKSLVENNLAKIYYP